MLEFLQPLQDGGPQKVLASGCAHGGTLHRSLGCLHCQLSRQRALEEQGKNIIDEGLGCQQIFGFPCTQYALSIPGHQQVMQPCKTGAPVTKLAEPFKFTVLGKISRVYIKFLKAT